MGVATPRAVAPTGIVPASASLASWRRARRGHLRGCYPCRRCLCPQAPPLQALAMLVSDCDCWQQPFGDWSQAAALAGGPGHSQLPLQVAWPWVNAPTVAWLGSLEKCSKNV
ncbi:hypothetical protein B296_00009467 [Ensete ventricosum]|uniref:Uncharacterized protein n=1 Tax=Ensete ventricosum TaxID=4639 RepID=A0A426XD99_ENSVE|nr:hypothetical protein B296_00009467 [Ensete ventricosum]